MSQSDEDYGHLFRSENHGLDVIVRDIFAAEPERPELSSPAHVSRRVKW